MVDQTKRRGEPKMREGKGESGMTHKDKNMKE